MFQTRVNGVPRTYRALPRDLARKMAKDWFKRFPKVAYDTKVESRL